MRLLLLIIIALCPGLESSPAFEPPTISSFSVDQIVDRYIDLAFGSEFPPSGTTVRGDRIFKRDPDNIVNIVPLPKPSAPLGEVFSLVTKVALDLEAQSGGIRLKVFDESNILGFLQRNQPALLKDYANSVIVYVGSSDELRIAIEAAAVQDPIFREVYHYWRDLPANAGKPLCMAGAAPNAEFSQVIGMAIVWVEYGPRLEECLYEEIIQSFGLANDLPVGTASMFNDDGVFDYPTQLDWKLWHIHTDPRLTAGMTASEVRKIVETILEEGAR
jgi:hypothetical protein